MHIKTVVILVFLSKFAICQDSAYLNYFHLGETVIPFYTEKYFPDKSPVSFLNMHGNELTSIKAAEAYINACGGTLTHILNEQERFVKVYLDGRSFLFDPNRVYSSLGRRSTLKILSASVNRKIEFAVAKFADKIVRSYLHNRILVIALHNNTDGELSVLSYQKEQAERNHWGAVFVNPAMDPDDFILTTDKEIYKRIKEKNINVIWENTSLITDDGSLSIYAGKHKIPYINVEAEHEHVEEQLSMLNALEDIIVEYSQKPLQSKPKRNAHFKNAKPNATTPQRANKVSE